MRCSALRRRVRPYAATGSAMRLRMPPILACALRPTRRKTLLQLYEFTLPILCSDLLLTGCVSLLGDVVP